MPKVQNKQRDSILPNTIARKLLKFCYFIALGLFLTGCGETKTEKKARDTPTDPPTEVTTTDTTKTILCFGDSITAGYGLDDSNEAYPALLQQKIDSLGLEYTVINAGISGETTAGGKGRMDWTLQQDIAIFILELGGNDGLRGVPLTETRANLQAIIDAVHTKSPETTIILAGMELPPNMGQAYTGEFRRMYAELAKENDLAFIPFILKDVGGVKALNQNDGIHPNAEGHEIVANTVWETLKPLISK
ncbi:arylesterase [Altibacter sp.]|uniref:arylesterase n=1 Tax=Altibacter sp. TaxID=2024823 RepID=UPI000C894813|nr:arylesterase [Altibacter sp.]MAP54441.1 arylesterase [Altibacter sp.]